MGRPHWFFRPEQTGDTHTDIASYQCEQFLFLLGAQDAEIVTATIANRVNPDTHELQDFGELFWLRRPR
jgi:predicted dehydrogenase